MTVYIDDVRHPFGRMVMCHLWADSLDELLAFVDQIGLPRRWLQQPPKASWVHFDVSLSLKAKALARGAILTDRYGPIEHLAKIDAASGVAVQVQRGIEKLAMIEAARRNGSGAADA